MSPDLKRKYELAVGEGRYDVVGEVRDIGDRRVESPKSIVGKSGAILAYTAAGAVNPTVVTLHETSVPAGAVKVATVMTVYETSVA